MASVFRKKRSSSTLHQQRPEHTSPSATTAAAQAFLKKQTDENGLSNAAAAAALRSYTPTPVSEVQTKRMQRRGSTSSMGSNASSQRQPFSSQVQRRGSNGSMSQRSFRSPSPGTRNQTPPVPALPSDVPPLPNTGVPVVPAKSSKRSVDTPTRIVSPSPPAKQRPESMESSRWASPKGINAAQSPALSRARDTASPTSPSSSPRNINFSRPMSPHMASPTPLNARVASPISHPASSLGLTPEQYRRLEERREAARLQEEDWIERERKRNEAQRIARETAQAKVARPRNVSGPSNANPVDGSSAPIATRPQSSGSSAPQKTSIGPGNSSLPLPRQRHKMGPSSVARTRPVSMPIGMTSPPTGNRVSSTPQTRSRIDMQGATSGQQHRTAPASTSAVDTIPSPSADQIKLFQTRAASLLARPLTDNSTAPSKLGPKLAANNALAAGTNKQHARSVSSPVASKQQNLPADKVRYESESPARSAHFSAAPLLEVTRHNPPPRSVSPVKSALKGSSPRPSSPVASHGREPSEAGSVLSDDGSTRSNKKKKSVRVSFEERPITVGAAAATTDSPTNNILSPQYKSKPVDEETFQMSPRPILPSFGSVRGRKSRSQENVTRIREDNFGGVDAGEARAIKGIAASLEEDETDEEDAAHALPTMQSDEAPDSNAPAIAVLPATPRFESDDAFAGRQEAPDKIIDDVEGTSAIKDTPPAASSHLETLQDSTKDDMPSTPDAAPPALAQPVEWTTPSQADDADSDADEDQFSDTVEDQSELEEPGGFASLAAILESPAGEATEGERGLSTAQQIKESSTTDAVDDHAAATAAAMVNEDTVVPASPPVDDWDTTTAYWSSLSEQQRQALEAKHTPLAANGVQRKDHQSTLATEKPRAQPNGSSRTAPKPQKSALKQPQLQASAQSSEPTHFRHSMRHSGTMMSSMRGDLERSPSRSSQPNRTKRMIQPQASAQAIALAQATAKSMAAQEAKRKASADDERQNDQRGRASKRDDEFHYSMARSMRDGRAAPPSRPLSMDADTSSSRRTLRGSVRHSIDTVPESKSGGFLGLGKPKAKASRPKKSSSGAMNKIRSRFADSSDEDSDDGGRQRFRSRFADSDDSDDDTPVKPMNITLTPVRGIPKRRGQEEGDSTDLEDSDDEGPSIQPLEPALPRSSKDRPGTPPASAVLSFGKSPGPAGIEVSKHAPVTSDDNGEISPSSPAVKHANGHTAEGNVLAAGTLRDYNAGKDNRHSLISFGRKSKGDEEPRSGALAESKWANAPGSPPSRPQTPSRGFAKTLRDREPGRDKEKRTSMFRRFSAGRGHTSVPTTPADAKHGKEEFPFPPPPIPQEYQSPTSPEKQRPNTSDGFGRGSGADQETMMSGGNNAQRPGMGDKRESAMTAPLDSPGKTRRGRLTKDPIVSTRTGKKKKFQGLRRAFGLND